ncbi:MAG: LpqB family beta-propeller domain-containing protein [Roseiflexaceae bacterium]
MALLVLMSGAILWWWYPREPAIAFVAGSEDFRSTSLMIMAADGSGQALLLASDKDRLEPDWSPDGQQIVFASGDIFVIQADGTHRRQLTDHTSTGLAYYEPAWSPDGTRLAFVAAPPTTEGQGRTSLYIMQVDGSNVVKLTTGDQTIFAPTWSPDGTQISFTLVNGDQSDIAIMQIADRHYRNITNTGDASEMCGRWSPNGQWIVFESDGGHFAQSDISIIRPNGADRTQLTDIRGVNSTPGWSPDGSQIVFISDRDFKLRDLNQQPSLVSLLLCPKIPDLYFCSVEQAPYGTAIYVMNADGSNARRLTDSIGWKWSPIWRG